MYKLLIADDEMIEREAIQFFIKKAGLEFYTIEEASNGIQAILNAKELMPDIIIMDIKMPGKNGLEAAGEIRWFKPDCRIIFLTAFDEFEYAHQAIKLKAEDFIIKPAYGENLIEILTKVISDLDKSKATMDKQKDLENRVAIFSEWFDNDLLLSIAKGYIEENRLNDYFAKMDIYFNSAICAIIHFRQRGNDSSAITNYSNDHIKKRIKSIIETECNKNKVRYLSASACSSIYLLIMANNMVDKKWGENLFRHIRKTICEQLNIEIQIGAGSIFQRPEGVSNSFFQAKIACTQKNAEGIVSFENMDKAKICNIYPLGKERKLCENIIKGDDIEAGDNIEEIMDWISQFSGSIEGIKERVHELLIVVDRAVIREFGVETVLVQNSLVELNSFNSINEIIIFIKNVVSVIIVNINSFKKSSSDVLIDKVCNYIDQNYHRDIKLDEMCAMVGFSRCYFSKIFRQYKNMNFVDYIAFRRMKKAKGLLKNPKFSIKEISSEIGYNDPNYFTSVFKKQEGISPTEFRSKHLG